MSIIERLRKFWREANKEYPCNLWPECKKIWEAERKGE